MTAEANGFVPQTKLVEVNENTRSGPAGELHFELIPEEVAEQLAEANAQEEADLDDQFRAVPYNPYEEEDQEVSLVKGHFMFLRD